MSPSSAREPTALLRVAQMNEADRLTAAAGKSGVELMWSAGSAVAREVRRRWPRCRVSVLCGRGNNGGDGFVAARALAEAGWPVRLALDGALSALRGDAAHHAAAWHGPILPLTATAVADADLIVDAVVGAGLNRPLGPDIALTLAAAAGRGVPLVAVDVPSGLAGDTGESPGAVAAACTVTFTRKKPGHVLMPGRELCGDVVVADIGTPTEVLDAIAVDTWENHPGLWLHALPTARAAGNKFTRGHALVSGGYPMTGAARLAARAAARAGAGLTSIAVPEVALPIYAAALTSIMVRPIARPEDFAQLLADSRYSALLLGPGAGVGEATRERALALLATGRAVLLDADAISAFAGRSEQLTAAIRGPCVLTPHDGEFARLFATTGDKLTRARAAAQLSGAIIVLKGADTVIAAADGRAVINSNAPPTLATAGAGDVLGGIILGLMAQGMDAFLAACAGVWLHGAAAHDFGTGLIAEDLPDLLPAVLRRLTP